MSGGKYLNIKVHKINRVFTCYISMLKCCLYTCLFSVMKTMVPQLLNSSVRFEECILYVLCDVPGFQGICEISYGRDPSYNDLGIPSRIPANNISSLLLPFSSTVYFYKLSHLVNSTLVVQFRDYFHTAKCEIQLDINNRAL